MRWTRGGRREIHPVSFSESLLTLKGIISSAQRADCGEVLSAASLILKQLKWGASDPTMYQGSHIRDDIVSGRFLSMYGTSPLSRNSSFWGEQKYNKTNNIKTKQ